MLTYGFKPVEACDMCGADPAQFNVMGLRLNGTQGLNPRAASGIAVTVKKCRRCELVFADPQPYPLDMAQHYDTPPADYWKPSYFADDPNYFHAENATAKRLLGFRQGMRALDVGAGIGKGMRALAAAGFDAYGLEPSSAFRSAAITYGGISEERLALTTAEDADYPADYFDFISFGAVLEHLCSPSAALERALGWLKPGGIIQLEVPSSRWLIPRLINFYYRLTGTHYVTNISPMHVPYHLFEFGVKSFDEHGRRAGYELALHLHRVCTLYHVPRLLQAPLRWLMERTGTGMQLAVYLRKVKAPGIA